MNITCTTLEEMEDGSAIVQLEMDEQSKTELISMGFVFLLEKYIEQQQVAAKDKEDPNAEWHEFEEDLAKLEDRKSRSQIKGSGDNR